MQHVSIGRPDAGFLPLLGQGRDAADLAGGVTKARVEPRLGRTRPVGRIHVCRGRGLQERRADRGFAPYAAGVHRRRHHRLAEPVLGIGRMVVALHELGPPASTWTTLPSRSAAATAAARRGSVVTTRPS